MTPQEEKSFDRKMKRWVLIVALVGMFSGCVSNAVSETFDWTRFGLGLSQSSNHRAQDDAKRQGALEQRVTTLESVVADMVDLQKSDHDKIMRMEPVIERMGKWLDRQGVE